jgi:hypothetical protein
MKKSLILLIILISNQIFSQTKLDSLIFKKINTYRYENSTFPVSLSKKLCKVSENQSEYCSKVKFVTLTQDIDVDSFVEEKNTMQRFSNFIDTTNVKSVRECGVLVINYNDTMSIEDIAEEAVESLKSDDETKDFILSLNANFLGVGHKVGNEYEETVVNIETMEEYTTKYIGTIYFITINYVRGLVE